MPIARMLDGRQISHLETDGREEYIGRLSTPVDACVIDGLMRNGRFGPPRATSTRQIVRNE
jgi:hypothetical protein